MAHNRFVMCVTRILCLASRSTLGGRLLKFENLRKRRDSNLNSEPGFGLLGLSRAAPQLPSNLSKILTRLACHLSNHFEFIGLF